MKVNEYATTPIPKDEEQFTMRIVDIIKTIRASIGSSNIFDFNIPVYSVIDSRFVNTGTTETVFTTTQFVYNLTRFFANRKVLFTNAYNDVDINTTMLFNNFKYMFDDYVIRKADSWGRIIGARASNFSPIANYDKYSNGKITYNGSETTNETPTGSEANTRVTSGSYRDTFNKGAETNTNTQSVTSFDSTNFNDDSKNIESRSSFVDTNERTYSNFQEQNTLSFTNRKTETTRSFSNRNDENNLHEFGNIGVMTTISILREYLDFYRSDITSEILLDFIDEISFY